MPKCRFSFDVDLDRLTRHAKSTGPLDVEGFLDVMLFDFAQKESLKEIRRLQKDDQIEESEKRDYIAINLMRIMLLRQAQANFSYSILSDDVVLKEDLLSCEA